MPSASIAASQTFTRSAYSNFAIGSQKAAAYATSWYSSLPCRRRKEYCGSSCLRAMLARDPRSPASAVSAPLIVGQEPHQVVVCDAFCEVPGAHSGVVGRVHGCPGADPQPDDVLAVI